nr:MAG TPA: hypothetical protein [Caudoviricetes sp.]
MKKKIRFVPLLVKNIQHIQPHNANECWKRACERSVNQ